MIPTHVTHDSDILTVHWPEGAPTRFHAIWLRDNAQGADYRHPGNDQRLFDLTEIPRTPRIESAKVLETGVRVLFAPESITVDFPADYLRDYAYDTSPADAPSDVWDSDLENRLVRHDYEVVSQDSSAKLAWMEDLIRDGLAILTNVPQEDGMVCRTAELFGFVRDTNYGRLFEVRTEEKPTNLAFTPMGLNVHTDNPYRDPVPGLQLLHCLINTAEGGQSVFVDGFRTAQLLRDENPAAFDLLTGHQAPFRFRDSDADLQARGPYIRLDDRGKITSIRYNNRSSAPLDLPFDVMADYYEALRLYADLLHREDGEIRLKMGPGDLVAFDNERVLHGRTGFSGGQRHLQGCYADKDSLRSLASVLSRPPQKEAAE